MAILASTAVTIIDSYQGGGRQGNKFSYRRVKAVLATQGGTTNKLVAGAFSLRLIAGISPMTKSDNSAVQTAGPSVDGSFAVINGGDISGTYYFTIWGSPL